MVAVSAVVQAAARSPRLLRVLRFSIVGGGSGAVYFGIVYFLVAVARLSPTLASGLAYLAILPANFLLQKIVVFKSEKPPALEALRYLVMHGTAFLVSMLVMFLMTEIFGLSHWAGSVAVIVVVACLSYLIMEVWVFSEKAKHNDKSGPVQKSALLGKIFTQQASPRLWRLAQAVIGGTPDKRALLRRAFKGEKRVVEVGCSIGNIARELISEKGVTYLGVDIDEGALAYARAWFRDYPNFRFSSRSMQELAGDEPPFDLICVTGVLHHVPDDVAMDILRGARAVAGPESRLLMFDPIPFQKGDSLVYRLIHRIEQGEYLREQKVLRSMIEKAGFRIETDELQAIGPGLTPVPKIMTFSVITARPA